MSSADTASTETNQPKTKQPSGKNLPTSDANVWIVDHQLKAIAQVKGVEILSSPEAWQELSWSHEYFKQEPKEGFFIWIKQQPPCALATCVNIKHSQVEQHMQNLIVVEPGLKIKLSGLCSALSLKLKALHQAEGTVILKQSAQVEYNQRHRWGLEDVVVPHYRFILEQDSQLLYTYSTKRTAKKMNLANRFELADRAKVQLNIIAECTNTEFESMDEIILNGDHAQGTSTLRFVSRENAKIKAKSRMVAYGASSGHLDCQSLNLADSAQASLIPELMVNNSQAQITHEASIGRVSPDQLNYLRMRGLTEEEAIELIASGFLAL
jgi:Fe-S cluster assembly scaffold protein SufB